MWILSRTLEKGGPRPGHARRARLPSAPDAGRRRRELTREGVFARERPEGGWNLAPPRHAELLPQNIAMRLGGSRRDAEPFADLFVRAAERDQDDDLQLTFRQPEVRTASVVCHGATLCRGKRPNHRPMGVFAGRLDASRAEASAHEARLVPARVRLVELVLGERADAEEQVELVA
jgi:hypothetical protein